MEWPEVVEKLPNEFKANSELQWPGVVLKLPNKFMASLKVVWPGVVAVKPPDDSKARPGVD